MKARIFLLMTLFFSAPAFAAAELCKYYPAASVNRRGKCLDNLGQPCHQPGKIGDCGYIKGDLEAFTLPRLGDDTVGIEHTTVGINKQRDLLRTILTNFSKKSLRGAKFEGSFAFANFDEADLTDADFSSVELSGASFNKAKASQASFESANILSGDFVEADLQYAYFGATKMSYADFTKANLRSAVLHDNIAEHVVMDRAFLINISIENGTFNNSNFRHARFSEASIVTTNFSFSDFRRADFGIGRKAVQFHQSQFNYAILCNVENLDAFLGLDTYLKTGFQHTNLEKRKNYYKIHGGIYIEPSICEKFAPRAERLSDYSTKKKVSWLQADGSFKIQFDQVNANLGNFTQELTDIYHGGIFLPAGDPDCEGEQLGWDCKTDNHCPVWILIAGNTVTGFSPSSRDYFAGTIGNQIRTPQHPMFLVGRAHYAKTAKPDVIADVLFNDESVVNSLHGVNIVGTFLLHVLPGGSTADFLATPSEKSGKVWMREFLQVAALDVGSALTFFAGGLVKAGSASVTVAQTARAARVTGAVLLTTGINLSLDSLLQNAGTQPTYKTVGGVAEILIGALILRQNLRMVLHPPPPPRAAPNPAPQSAVKETPEIFQPKDFPPSRMKEFSHDPNYSALGAAMANEAKSLVPNQLEAGFLKKILDKLGEMRKTFNTKSPYQNQGGAGVLRSAGDNGILHPIWNDAIDLPAGLRHELHTLIELEMQAAKNANSAKLIAFAKEDGKVVEGILLRDFKLASGELQVSNTSITIQSSFLVNLQRTFKSRINQGRFKPEILADVEKRLLEVQRLMGMGNRDEALKEFARSYYSYMQACPFQMGTDAIGRSTFDMLFGKIFGKARPFNDGLDVKAMVIEQEAFTTYYFNVLKQLFGYMPKPSDIRGRATNIWNPESNFAFEEKMAA